MEAIIFLSSFCFALFDFILHIVESKRSVPLHVKVQMMNSVPFECVFQTQHGNEIIKNLNLVDSSAR